MGLVLGFGVAVALLLAMTLTPILFWLMKTPQPWNDEVSKSQQVLTRILSGIQQLSLKKPLIVVLIFTIGFATHVSFFRQSHYHHHGYTGIRIRALCPQRLLFCGDYGDLVALYADHCFAG